MYYVLNIVVIALIALIAYWWGNQGLFSAILHLICVVFAGAVALAVWEPLTFLMLNSSKGFSNYAWGVTLLGSFALALFLFRLALDKLAPSNVRMPHWADLTFGMLVGAVAGVLTMGIVIIGAGFIQTSHPMLGLYGWARSARNAEIRQINTLWVPVHQITSEFYGLMSVTSLSTSHPLRHYSPDLYKQVTLVRDSFSDGRGALAMPPDGADIRRVWYDADRRRYAVQIHLSAKAADFGEQITISRAQMRLIGDASGKSKAGVSFPDQWTQETASAGGLYSFADDPTAYITSVAGQETADVIVQFPEPPGGGAKYLQIRGTRFALPQAQTLSSTEFESVAGQIVSEAISQALENAQVGNANITSAVNTSTRISGLNVGVNQMPGGMHSTDERFLDDGHATFSRSAARPPRKLAVQGLYEPPGTRVVQVDVSRNSPANIFGAVAYQAGENAPIFLVDDRGDAYPPLGYVYWQPNGIEVKLAPGEYVRTIEELPSLPRAGDNQLNLVFTVTKGRTIVALRVGDLDVGRCNVPVTEF
jgi:hypothetical protein